MSAQGDVIAVVGQHDQTQVQKEIEYQVQCSIIHPKYKSDENGYDIALFITKQPIKYSKYVRPVCLPKIPRQFDGKTMKVSGWGKLDGKSSDGSTTLHAAEVNGINWGECQKAYNGTLENHMFCAIGYKDDNKTVVDSCSGDSGGRIWVWFEFLD